MQISVSYLTDLVLAKQSPKEEYEEESQRIGNRHSAGITPLLLPYMYIRNLAYTV